MTLNEFILEATRQLGKDAHSAEIKVHSNLTSSHTITEPLMFGEVKIEGGCIVIDVVY